MDSESLDGCIQSTLSALYPPFEVTAATVLCQVFDVVEKTYRGDGLRYLIDFLIPAKHILQCVQQDACVQYCGFLFRHEGWPLCVHEKIIVQLASLDWRLLKPGDFYLQVVPYLKKSPRIIVKCLAKDRHNVEELVVPEVSYTSIFTTEWLNGINGGRMGATLENCLLATDGKIFRVPWEKIVNPEFIDKPKAMESNLPSDLVTKSCSAPTFSEEPLQSTSSETAVHTSHGPNLLGSNSITTATAGPLERAANSSDGVSLMLDEDSESDPEGEYVELSDVFLPRVGPQMESLTQSEQLSLSYCTKTQPRAKSQVAAHPVNGSCSLNGVCLALTSMPHGQLDTTRTPDSQGGNPGICLENRPAIESEQLLLKIAGGSERNPTSVVPGTKEPSQGKPQAHPEYELDWRYAVCSYTDSEDAERKPPTVGTLERIEVAGGANAEEGNGGGESMCCLGVSGTEAMPGGSRVCSVLAEEVLLSVSDPGHLRLCCSCDDGSGNQGQPENAFLQPITFLLPTGHISSVTGTDSHPLQELSSGVIDHCSEQVGGVPLPDGQVEEVSLKPVVMLAKPDRDSGSEGEPREVAQQGLVGQEKQNGCGEFLSFEGQVGGCLFPKEGQKKVCAFQKQAEDALQLGSTSGAPGRPVAEQENSASSPAKSDVQSKGFSNNVDKEGTEACWVDHLSEQKPLLLETSMDGCGLGCLAGQRDANSQNGSAREELYTWTLVEAKGKSDPLEISEQPDPNEPGMEDTPSSPSAPLTDRSPGSIGHGNPSVMNGDQDAAPEAFLVREASFKWAEKITGEAGKPGLAGEAGKPCCTWEESAVHVKHQNPLSLPSGGNLQTAPMAMKDVNLEVLQSGIACLPGTRDKSGRAVIIITMRNTVWLNPHCNTNELTRLLLYLRSILRPECQSLGLTILVDARRCSPVPALFKALAVLQDVAPHCIHVVLLLVEKEVTFRMEKPASVQVELLTSIKSLHKHIDNAKLPLEFDGALPYCHQDWLRFRMRLEHLLQGCQGASVFLAEALQAVESSTLPDKAEEASAVLKHYRQLMKTVLEDSRLVRLQLEGGALLARLRKEESCVTLTEDYRDALEAVVALYNRVDEGIHQLVKVSNKQIEALELVMDFEAFEECFREVSSWMENVGQRRLAELVEMDESVEVLRQAQKQFQDFELVANEYCQRGQEALRRMGRWEDVSSTKLCTAYGVRLQMRRNQLHGFCSRLEASRRQIDWTAKLFEFFDQAYEWALDGMRRLSSISMEDCSSQEHCSAALRGLESYKEQHPEISEARFQEAKELARQLGSSSCLQQWQFAWSKCQETKLAFEMKLEAALRTKKPPGPESERSQDGAVQGSPGVSHCQGRPSQLSGWAEENALDQQEGVRAGEQVVLQDTAPRIPEAPKPPRCARDEKSTLESIAEALEASPPCPSTPASRQLFPRKILRKAQSFDLACTESLRSSWQRTLSEPARYGITGVFIKGLEVSSTELVDRTGVARQHLAPTSWSAGCAPEERRSDVSVPDAKSWGSKLRHIIDEMVTTEQEYVRSLRYIIESYFPEMERADLPQDLRGKRSVIFGNLEKLYDFHSQYFLRELESCCNHPLRVSHCFLRHKDQFGMYALYSKNKPKSDSLLASRGNTFFKCKQLQLGDKMDLASYLLKPIQRMSKYALLLKDLIKQCGEAQEQELVYLRAAEEMVRFQLRHGNDLLAMDAIRDCDVNLKEQGQLVRQDEFSVCLGRRKCQRHVFLFEDLILFSKPKRIEGGFDVYIYKRSFKTADIGLTENSGESGLRFEIWFRRRKSSDTYILQASSTETKQAWTSDITKILWEQAARNKEIRMQEMVSMGVGNKPFLDIKPSEAAIHDRAIDYIMKGRGARTRASIAVSLFDHINPYKRSPAPLPSSGPSSCSVLGPLNLHMYLEQAFLPSMLSTGRPFEADTCIEEDEMENETSSQPSMTESSGSSQYVSGSGSSSSDSGCVSSMPRDGFCEDLGPPLSPPVGSSLASPLEEKSCFPKSQYVSAV